MPPIALLTDFGTREPYAAQMKGVILGCLPDAVIIDVTHSIEPFNLAQAAFFLAATHPWYPPETIFITVVDPGVGSHRRVVLLEKFGRRFIAPDNGLLSLLLLEPAPARAFDISDFRGAGPVSDTFHGRDIMSPAAAHVARTGKVDDMGPELLPNELVRLDWAEPRDSFDTVEASVLHVDRFGNCLLNMPVEPWVKRLNLWNNVSLRLPARRALRKVTSYAALGPDEVGLLAGSQGYMEICQNRNQASRTLGLSAGSQVVLRREESA